MILYFYSSDKDDDAGQNKTVKPTATMTLYKDGSDISGGTVQLTDIVTMILQLDAEYIRKSNNQGSVVQTIVSLMSLRGQLVKCFTTF